MSSLDSKKTDACCHGKENVGILAQKNSHNLVCIGVMAKNPASCMGCNLKKTDPCCHGNEKVVILTQN